MNGDVIEFWFGQEQKFRPEWFAGSREFDEKVTELFADRIELGLGQEPSSHLERLGLILLFDQFPRHVYRNGPRSFHYDRYALKLAKASPLIDDCGPFSLYEAYFYMLPFEHSENIEDQRVFVSFIGMLSRNHHVTNGSFVKKALEVAVEHKAIIERYGRFPYRNGILGRASSEAEHVFLSRPGSGTSS